MKANFVQSAVIKSRIETVFFFNLLFVIALYYSSSCFQNIDTSLQSPTFEPL